VTTVNSPPFWHRRSAASSPAEPISLPLALALIDAAVGLYILQYAVRRQRRDKGALLVTAVFLLLAALALTMIGLLPQPGEPGRLPPLQPAGELV
jgi:hypothetical protein